MSYYIKIPCPGSTARVRLIKVIRTGSEAPLSLDEKIMLSQYEEIEALKEQNALLTEQVQRDREALTWISKVGDRPDYKQAADKAKNILPTIESYSGSMVVAATAALQSHVGVCLTDQGEKLTDAQVDRILSTVQPGGSHARDWFLPHEHPKGLENVRNVVRSMIVAAAACTRWGSGVSPLHSETGRRSENRT